MPSSSAWLTAKPRSGRSDERHPSVAIVDLHMPKIGGMELTELLRGRRSARSVPIVVLTGSGGPAEWKRLSALGADGFLVKPVNIKDVATLLRRVLAERARATPLPDRAARETPSTTPRRFPRHGTESHRLS